jgi:hypothetical protein
MAMPANICEFRMGDRMMDKRYRLAAQVWRYVVPVAVVCGLLAVASRTI